MSGHFGYLNITILCGECAYGMDGGKHSDHSQKPFVYIVTCPNPHCSHYGKKYKVGEGVKVDLQEV